MAEILILKDLVTPLLTALLGTAAGGFLVSFISNEKIEYDSIKSKINYSNLIIVQCAINIDSLFTYLKKTRENFDHHQENKIIANNLYMELSKDRPSIRMVKNILSDIDHIELKTYIIQATSSTKIILLAAQFSEAFNNLKNTEKQLHELFDAISSIININEKKAVADLFGISNARDINNSVESTYLGFIDQLEFSILALEEISKLLHKNMQMQIKEFESFNFKKLPTLVNANIDKITSHHLYPKKDKYPLLKMLS